MSAKSGIKRGFEHYKSDFFASPAAFAGFFGCFLSGLREVHSDAPMASVPTASTSAINRNDFHLRSLVLQQGKFVPKFNKRVEELLQWSRRTVLCNWHGWCQSLVWFSCAFGAICAFGTLGHLGHFCYKIQICPQRQMGHEARASCEGLGRPHRASRRLATCRFRVVFLLVFGAFWCCDDHFLNTVTRIEKKMERHFPKMLDSREFLKRVVVTQRNGVVFCFCCFQLVCENIQHGHVLKMLNPR